jgi:hypothetical protein
VNASDASSHGNMDLCGFVCPSCSFLLRLSEENVSQKLVEAFKSGASSVTIPCPECSNETTYMRRELKLFLPGGKYVPLTRGTGAAS